MLFGKINIFSIWLIILGIAVSFIILIGGYTRISDSGLSITEWLPLKGIFYPMTDSAWLIEFEKYKQIDEFMLVNSAMTLSEFKHIYFWEWFHRAFARLIGIIYILPFFILIVFRKINYQLISNIIWIGAFLMIQSIVGWYMVKSGLSGRVDVSQYRLSIHLAIAFFILGMIVLTFIREQRITNNINKNVDLSTRSRLLTILLFLIFFQILYGAFVSGTDAGLIFNTWPDFNGRIIPGKIEVLTPYYLNIFENKNFIIFFHRTFAFILLFYLIYLNIDFFKKKFLYKTLILFFLLDFLFILQILIGIAMTYLNIPWFLALVHQGNSIILFLVSVYMYGISRT